MTAKHLETINDHLDKLGYAYFKPQEGALRERLDRLVRESLPGEAAEQLPQQLEIEVGIGKQDEGGDATLEVKVAGVEFPEAPQLPLEALSEAEAEELSGYLAPIVAERATREEGGAAGAAAQKAHEDELHHSQASAAARLKVTPEWLKSVIPCTDYTYEEIEGKKYIRDYFWSKELIERLVKIKSTKTTPEDLQYVMKECCDGDQDWAKDLIARLKSPNRPEPAPREQQKGQGKNPQQRQGGRPGQPKQLQAKPASQPQKGTPQKPAAAPAQGSGGGAPVAAAQGAGGAQNAGEGERTRSRSRHRKPFRHGNKDGSRKPEAPAGTKPTQ